MPVDLVLIPVDDMPRLPGLSVPRDLHVVLRSPALLGGMPRRSLAHASVLHDAGFRHVVRVEEDGPPYDASPLELALSVGLTDLVSGSPPADPEREVALIESAVQAVTSKLAAGEGVVVHCIGGRGRTGSVLGCALARLGHDPDVIVRYLDGIHRARERGGWPEAPWQADVVRRFAR